MKGRDIFQDVIYYPIVLSVYFSNFKYFNYFVFFSDKSKKSSVCTAITWSPNGNKRNNDNLSSPYKTDVIELNNMDSIMNC